MTLLVRYIRLVWAVVFILLMPSAYLFAENPSAVERGLPEFRLCSQNIHNFGDPKGAKEFSKAKRALVERFVSTRCDVLALQEVYGEKTRVAEKNLNKLRKGLEEASGKSFEMYLGKTRDRRIRNAFLVRRGLGDVEGVKDFYRYSLPTLQVLGPVRYFPRAPLRLTLKVKKSAKDPSRTFNIYAIHFKSQADAWKDPTKTRYEVTRVEMAEAMREIVKNDLAENPQAVPIVLGDRNSDQHAASAQVLEGKLKLEDFSSRCRVRPTLEADCKMPSIEADWVAIISKLFPSSSGGGTFRFRSQMEVLDDILIRKTDELLVRDGLGKFSAGTFGELGLGSDHKLVYVDINW